MGRMTRAKDIFRTSKLYTTVEAARIAGTHPATVRRWILGYTDTTGHMEPVFGDKQSDIRLMLSFLELAELIVAVAFRREGLKLHVIRSAHAWAGREFETPYPFAHLKLIQYGGHILHEFEEKTLIQQRKVRLVVLDMRGQYALPEVVRGQVLHFEYDKDLAVRWFPYGKNVPIVVDPRYGAGLPTITGRRLRVDFLVRRHEAGRSSHTIAKDFEMTVTEVRKVLKYAA